MSSFSRSNLLKIIDEIKYSQSSQSTIVVKEAETPSTQAPTSLRPKKCCMEGCKKKLLLSDYPCKCKQIFCSAHRFPETHACSFDFKKAGSEELAKRLGQAVIGKKLDSI